MKVCKPAGSVSFGGHKKEPQKTCRLPCETPPPLPQAWIFPRESSTMERSPLCSATPTSVSRSNLRGTWGDGQNTTMIFRKLQERGVMNLQVIITK